MTRLRYPSLTLCLSLAACTGGPPQVYRADPLIEAGIQAFSTNKPDIAVDYYDQFLNKDERASCDSFALSRMAVDLPALRRLGVNKEKLYAIAEELRERASACDLPSAEKALNAMSAAMALPDQQNDSYEKLAVRVTRPLIKAQIVDAGTKRPMAPPFGLATPAEFEAHDGKAELLAFFDTGSTRSYINNEMVVARYKLKAESGGAIINGSEYKPYRIQKFMLGDLPLGERTLYGADTLLLPAIFGMDVIGRFNSMCFSGETILFNSEIPSGNPHPMSFGSSTQLLVQAEILNTTVTLMIDTGAQNTVLYRSKPLNLADDSALLSTPVKIHRGTTSKEAPARRFTSPVDIRLGNAVTRVSAPAYMETTDEELQSHQGVLGLDVLLQSSFCLDLERMRLVFY